MPKNKCPYCHIEQSSLTSLLAHAPLCTANRKNNLAFERQDKPGSVQPARPTAKAEVVKDRKCLCPCGELVGGRAKFRPGHDAKLKALIKNDLEGKSPAKGVSPEAWDYARACWQHLIPGLKDS